MLVCSVCRRINTSANSVGCSAPRVGCEDNHAKSASTHLLCGRLAGFRQGEARAGRAQGMAKALHATFRSRSRRPDSVSVKKSLGRWRGLQCAPCWLRRQPRQVRQRAAALWAVGWFSTRQSTRGPRATEFESVGYERSELQPPAWCGVCEEEPRPTAWAAVRPALAAKTTTPSPPPRSCSVCGWLVLHDFTRQRMRGTRATEPGSVDYELLKLQPPTWHGVNEGEPRPTP